MLGLAAVLGGCGQQTVIASGDGDTSPYRGPLVLPQDHSDRATAEERSGAAGRAVECDFPVSNGGAADYDSGLASAQDSAEAALQDWFAEEGSWFSGLPTEGYRVERDDGDRVMFSYDVDQLSKAVVIVSDDVRDWASSTGWGVESWAACDPAELPPAFTEAAGIGVWTDRAGKPVPTTEVQSSDGPEHCDWDDIVFLTVGDRGTGRQYLRDTEGELAGYLRTTFADDVRVPPDAEDTGWRRDGWELWIAADAAFLVAVGDDRDVERWPGTTEPVACA